MEMITWVSSTCLLLSVRVLHRSLYLVVLHFVLCVHCYILHPNYRMERHVDAIFTNTYRKFLGQISARQYLQNMMGKRLGQADTRGQYPSASGRSDRSIRVLMNLKNPTWRAVQPRL
ncbi:somatoliberin isoform X5 [Pseudophryne corroboree]|uniref:somatoliberin isoform X5 n=1 Tax=Pseudophryne corroboree TaxID=495146 RepID=UPI003081BDE6